MSCSGNYAWRIRLQFDEGSNFLISYISGRRSSHYILKPRPIHFKFKIRDSHILKNVQQTVSTKSKKKAITQPIYIFPKLSFWYLPFFPFTYTPPIRALGSKTFPWSSPWRRAMSHPALLVRSFSFFCHPSRSWLVVVFPYSWLRYLVYVIRTMSLFGMTYPVCSTR